MMLKFWNNLSLDMKAVAATVAFVVAVYLISLAPAWVVTVIFCLAILYAVYSAAKMVFFAMETKAKWEAEEKEGNEK